MLLRANKSSDFRLPEDVSEEKHLFIVGYSGVGKSHAVKILSKASIELGRKELILDSADEHMDLCQFFPPEVLLVADPKGLKINFQNPPPNVDRTIWRGILINIFREGMYFRDGACNELNSILANLSANKPCPTFPDLYRAIMNRSYRAGSRRAEYIESLKNRSEMLLNSYISDALMCAKGHPLEEVLIKRSCVLRVGRIPNDLLRNFYVNFILKWMETYLTFNPHEQGENSRIIVIEEVHRYCYVGIKNRSDLREPIILSFAREIRKRNVSLIFTDQLVSLTPKQLLGNIDTFLIFRLINSSCIKAISDSCSLYPQQKELIPTLPKQVAIVHSGALSQPYLVEIIDFPIKKVSEEYIREKMDPVISSLPYTPLPGREDETDEFHIAGGMEIGAVSSRKIELKPRPIWKMILEKVAEKGFFSLTQLYEEIGASPRFMRRVIGEMEDLRMVDAATLSLGRRGNPTTYILMKPKGAEFLGTKYEYVKLPGKGSTSHILIQNLVVRKLNESGRKAAVEYYLNGKSADVAEFTEDKTMAYEIEMEPNQHVAENIVKDLEAGYTEVVVISKNNMLENEIKDIVYRSVDLAMQDKVSFRLLRDIL